MEEKLLAELLKRVKSIEEKQDDILCKLNVIDEFKNSIRELSSRINSSNEIHDKPRFTSISNFG